MKRIVKISCFFLLSLSSVFPGKSDLSAQVFTVDTILYNGSPNKFINLVFMGDGFQTGQLASYITSVQNLTNYFFTISPLAQYKNYFNVFAIRVPSTNSGTDHPGTATDVTEPVFPVSTVNTYFSSTFDYGSIHRLLVATDFTAENNVILANFPLYDQRLMLVNSTNYGGSGGGTAVSSLNSSSFDILVHEFGHSFAALADEYYAGPGYMAEKANMTQQTNPTLVKWKNWMGFGGVGIYQHCCGGNSALWYRPHNSCVMRYLGSPFCPVCKEAIIEKIHQNFGTPVIASQPTLTSVGYCTQPIKFKMWLTKPIPNTLRVKWKLNGTGIASNIDSVTITSLQLNSGVNTLSVQILDTTALIRDSLHIINHSYSIQWTINYSPLTTPTIIANGSTTLCQGSAVALTTGTATSYLWSNGATTQSIAVSTSGNYSVTVTNGNGCSATSTTTTVTVNSLPATPTINLVGTTLSSASAMSYQWYINGNIINGATSQTYVVTQNGNYSVVIKDNNGCSATSATFNFNDTGMGAGIVEDLTSVIIIPNPTKGIFRIETKNLSLSKIKIANAAGEIIYESASGNSEIDLSTQPKGTYFIELLSQNKTYNKKLIIQ